MKPLTPKQKRFVDEYLVDSNAAAAAVRAGYSERTAKEIGCENLTKPNIAAAVKAGQEKLSEKSGINAEWALARLRIEAEYYGEGCSAGARVSAIGHALKVLGLLKDQVEVKNTSNLTIKWAVRGPDAGSAAASSTA